MELICTNGKRDSGTKLTSPELCEPFTQTVNRTITDTHSTENLTCLNWDFDISPFSSAPLWSNFESIAIHNCTGISQTRTYSPTCKRKIDSRKGAWEEGTQRPAARIQRRDWPRVWEFPPSFAFIRINMRSSGLSWRQQTMLVPPFAAFFPTCPFNKPKGKEDTWHKKCK